MMNLKLILKDGTEIIGESFGYWPKPRSSENFRKTIIGKPSKRHFFVDGEVVFNTAMVGYPETLTDPSYRGQMVVMTYPMIGNYGVPAKGETHGVSKKFESNEVHLRGLIISEECEASMHWEAKQSLGAFLKKHKIPAIKGVDTRALTQKLREYGVMLGKMVEADEAYFEGMEFSDPNAGNLVAEVSVKEKTVLEPTGKVVATVALLDCGIKHNILRSFLNKGVRVIRLPWDTDLSKVRNKYDGVFVSNGPGDPQMADKTIESMKWAMQENKIIFGICLGSQIMGLAAGAKTYKLKYGHRSANQPCVDVINNRGERCYITSQNHGFAVDEKTLPPGWKVWFRNANDDTVEGIRHFSKPWFSVQFHPEASPGPEDASYLLDEFIAKMTKS